MANFIMTNFKGVKVTLAVTGLPAVITGEVLGMSTDNIIGIRLDNGTVIYVNAALIAFVF